MGGKALTNSFGAWHLVNHWLTYSFYPPQPALVSQEEPLGQTLNLASCHVHSLLLIHSSDLSSHKSSGQRALKLLPAETEALGTFLVPEAWSVTWWDMIQRENPKEHQKAGGSHALSRKTSKLFVINKIMKFQLLVCKRQRWGEGREKCLQRNCVCPILCWYTQ